MSPEDFALKAKLSHMTIRRWLRKGDREVLPSKYNATLAPLFGKAPPLASPKVSVARVLGNLSLDSLMAEIEKSGRQFTDMQRLEKALTKKLKSALSDKIFQHCCRELLEKAKSRSTSVQAKAIARGALLYFVDPRRMPEDTPLVVYLSELAVLSIALNGVYSLK
jgi:hypothetical protein